MLSVPQFLDDWQACERDRRRDFLAAHVAFVSEDVLSAMKDRVTELIWSNADEALGLAQSIHDLADLTGNPLQRAFALVALGNVYAFGLGQYLEAAELYGAATLASEEAGNEPLATRAPTGQVYALGMLGRHEEALALGERVRERTQAHQDWVGYTRATTNMAIACRRRGDYARAISLYDEQKAVLHTYLSDQPGYLEELFRLELNRSTTLRSLNRYREAIEAARAALDIANVLDNPVRRARAKDSLGLTYFFLGQYNDALACFQRARRVFQVAHLPRDAVVVQLFEAQCLLALNELEAVEESCTNVIEYCRVAGMDHEVATALAYRATARRRLRKLVEAARDLEDAAAIFQAHRNHSWLGQIHLERAYLFLDGGEPVPASEAATTARDCFERLNLPVETAQALLAEGLAAEELGRFKRARHAYRTALTAGQRRDLPWLIFPACYGLARVAHQEGYLNQARARLDQAIQAVERLRAGVAVDLRIPFLADKLDIYAQAVALALENRDNLAAFRYVERAKSRALLDLFQDETSIRLQALDPADREVVEEINRLRERRRWLEQRAGYRPIGETYDGTTPADREAWLEEANLCEQRIQKLFRDLQIRNASYTSTRSLSAVFDEPLGPHLPPATRLVEYFVLRDDLWAFVIGPDEIHVRRLAPLATLRDLIARWRLHLVHAVALGPDMATLVPAARALLARFHRIIFEPLTEWCAGATRLYVVPHGVLHYLPFSALYDATHDAYVVEQFAVARLPSAGVLPALAARKRTSSPCAASLVLGNSHEGLLPQAVQEARTISETVRGECYVEEEARLALLLEGQARRPLIHVAAHGLFRPDAPLFSAIYLADGPLTTLDIFNSRLQTDLLTLSACESGLGTVHPGDEVMGLSRACLHAGAQSLLLSLWRVEDRSTHEFMTDFYRYVVAGNSPAEALCLVQRNRLAVPDTAHPFYWAAFSITGDAYTPIPFVS